MATKKISELVAAAYVAATDLFELAIAGVESKKVEARVLRGQKVTALTSSAGVVNIDLSLGSYFTLTLTENVTSITFSNAPGSGFGQTVMLLFTQAASAKTVTWPASFKWEGAAPAVSTSAGANDLLALTTLDNGGTWQATLSKGRA